jgi:hypothetical protein
MSPETDITHFSSLFTHFILLRWGCITAVLLFISDEILDATWKEIYDKFFIVILQPANDDTSNQKQLVNNGEDDSLSLRSNSWPFS